MRSPRKAKHDGDEVEDIQPHNDDSESKDDPDDDDGVEVPVDTYTTLIMDVPVSTRSLVHLYERYFNISLVLSCPPCSWQHREHQSVVRRSGRGGR